MDKTGIRSRALPSREHTIIYLVVIYTVGIVGMLVPEVRSFFIFLVPLNIVLAFAVVLLYHSPFNRRFWWVCIAIYLGGFLIEWMGIKTGVIFGPYEYGKGLGIKLFGVPLVMGLNWLLLVYGATTIVQKYITNHITIALVGAMLMVLYDLFLEPAAIRYGFWKWQILYIPLQNYLSWFFCSFVFIYGFSRLNVPRVKNSIGEAVFWLQLIFFVCLLAGNNLAE
jgi:putative membrane protein